MIVYLYTFEANLWNILTLNSNAPIQTNQSPLSSLSISVLLVLINHCTSPPPPNGNPYRTCISSLSGNNNFQTQLFDGYIKYNMYINHFSLLS